MASHQVGELCDLLPRTQLLFPATGHPGVIGAAALNVLRDGVVIARVGHMPWELGVGLIRFDGHPRSGVLPREDVHHGEYGEEEATPSPLVHAGVQGRDRRAVPAW
ncbi:hypothetical protein OG496_11210 [Streptomyces sp. NBC_00988]|nr:hypothetical protein OG496_11210 [Streptomyces sp. NBC_00988]